MRLRFTATVIIAVGFCCTIAKSAFAAEAPSHSVVVQGEARLTIPAEYATLTLGAVTQAPTVATALSQNNSRMNKVLDVIKRLGVAEKDIQTSDLGIEPRYQQRKNGDDYDSMRPVLGYSVSNKITVTIRELANVAKIIDQGATAGANWIGSVSFSANDLPTRMDDTHRKAVESARHKAQVLADAAHVRLGAPISVIDNRADTTYGSSGSVVAPPPPALMVEELAPIQAGQVTIDVAVTLVFATE